MRLFPRPAFLALALVAAMPLASCATLSNIPSAVEVVNKPVLGMTLADEKALATATNVYNFVARSYLTLNSRGQLSPTVKAKVKPLVQELYKGLKTARTAYEVGDAAGFNQKLAAFDALKQQIASYGVGIGAPA